MKLYIDSVYFLGKDEIDLGWAYETWEFTPEEINTPSGTITIEGFTEVDNTEFVGVELLTDNLDFQLDSYNGFDSESPKPEISTIAFVFKPGNLRLWLYMFNSDGDNIVTFCCHDDPHSFSKYIDELRKYDYLIDDFCDDEEDDDESYLRTFIPDAGYKSEQLSDQWIKGGWYYDYPSLRNYVRSLGIDDDVPDFFGWLFNDYRFKGVKEWDLPPEYMYAYEQFLKLFPDIDDCYQ